MSSIKMKEFRVDGVEVDLDAPDESVLSDVQRRAVAVLNSAKSDLATKNVVIAHEVAALGIPVFTDAIDTLAVTIGGDGIVRWMVNAEFVAGSIDTDVVFYLQHETDHVVLAHLVPDDALGSDEVGTLAKEVVINHRATRILGRQGVPTGPDGKPLIVCPKRTYDAYKKAKKTKGETPVDYDTFVSTDIACASYLREIPKPPQQKINVCVRCSGDPIPGDGQGGGSGDDSGDDPNGQSGNSGIDPEQAGKIVDGILGHVMTRALNGDEAARDALLDLGERLGEDHPLWGNLGLGALRGETPPPVEVSFWEQYLLGALTSILVPGCNLEYPRKMLAFEDVFAESGFRLPFQPVGEERRTKLGISIDTSGSMPAAVLNRLAPLVGNIPNCEVTWTCFDASVYPFEPGQPLRGGGGTSFDVVREWVEKRDDDPFDCVLVVTDGCAPPIIPNEPDKWVWLITPNGDLWAADKGMSCVIVDLPGND